MSMPGDNLSGWGAVGYGAAGGYSRDNALRSQIQQAALAHQKAMTGLTNTENQMYQTKIDSLNAAAQQQHYEHTLLANHIAANELDNATSALINNPSSGWQVFNNTIKSNPILAKKMQENYGVSDIRPIDWNNPQDMAQVEKLIPATELAKLKADGKLPLVQQEMGKSYFMTNAGHLASLGEFAQHTGYFDRATASQLNSFVSGQQKLQEALKPPTPTSIEADSMQKYLQDNPTKTYNDWVALNSAAKLSGKPPAREDRLTQLRGVNATSKYGKPYNELTPAQQREIDKAVSTIMDAGTGQGRENMDVNDINNAIHAGHSLLDGTGSNLTQAERDNLETQFKLTPVYSQYKKQLETFNNGFAQLKFAENFNKMFQAAIKNGTYKTGFIQNLRTTIDKYSPKELRSMMGLSDKELALKLGLQGTLGQMTAERLKLMSGTAASDDEFKRTVDYVVGSNSYNQNTQSVLLDNSVRNTAKLLANQGRLLVGSGFVGNTYDRYKEIEAYLNQTNKEPGQQVPNTQPTQPAVTYNTITPGAEPQGTPQPTSTEPQGTPTSTEPQGTPQQSAPTTPGFIIGKVYINKSGQRAIWNGKTMEPIK